MAVLDTHFADEDESVYSYMRETNLSLVNSLCILCNVLSECMKGFNIVTHHSYHCSILVSFIFRNLNTVVESTLLMNGTSQLK